MSYQPQAPPIAQPSLSTSGRGLTVLGILLFIVGLAAGGALFILSGQTEQDTVEKFARAPAGCTTTLEFDRADTYEVYLETSGKLNNVSGDCAANGASYNRADDDPPRVSLSFIDPNNAEVPLSPGTGATYDVGDFRGEAVQRVQITSTGTYQLTVTSDANDFVIAIGGESDADSEKLKLAAVGAAIAGVVIGFICLLLGNRSKKATPPPAVAWQPAPPPQQGWAPPRQ